MAAVTQKQKDEVISNFRFEGTLLSQEPYGSGHINDTFLLEFEIAEMGRLKVILQRMNREVFKKPGGADGKCDGSDRLSAGADH